jgi:hexosaminidase
LSDQSLLEPPAGQLRLANPSTTKYTTDLISAAAKLFPSKLFSTGGDELNKNCYDKDAQTQSELSSQGKTLEQALDTFIQATHKPLHDQNKTAVVWEGLSAVCASHLSLILTRWYY